FTADLSAETLSRTLLGQRRPGDAVNLERALRLGDRLDGHLVQGHVDTVTRVVAITPEGSFSRWRIHLPATHRTEVARKGSVALNGVSLTVAELGDDWFDVALIPATLAATSLGAMSVGDELHLETDVLAKYVARMVSGDHAARPFESMFGTGG
ncbi:MAG: riboflavin synthase, partial [Actinomycetota bacterium]|nr:riboflavin synthase [Actinomycetota bacterium]